MCSISLPIPIPLPIIQMLLQELQRARILSSQSKLFLALPKWTSTLFRDLSWFSLFLWDLATWSKEILDFSTVSTLLNLCPWNFSCSCLSVLFLGLSLRSALILGASKQSTLLLASSTPPMLFHKVCPCDGEFSIIDMNFLRCRRYSG